MKLKLINDDDELMTVFKQASASIRDKHTLFRKATANLKDGARFQAYDAYLKPVLIRKNLHVLLKTQAVSVSQLCQFCVGMLIPNNLLYTVI